MPEGTLGTPENSRGTTNYEKRSRETQHLSQATWTTALTLSGAKNVRNRTIKTVLWPRAAVKSH